MPSGWTRWLLEQFEFPFEVVYPQALDAGNLSSKYDVIIFPSGVGPAGRAGGGGRGGRGGGAQAAAGGGRWPAAARAAATFPRSTRRSSAPTPRRRPCPQLKKFLEDGGTILRSAARR